MADEPPRFALGEGAVVAVDVLHHVLGDIGLGVAGDGRVGVHGPAQLGVAVGHHDDELHALLGGGVDRLGQMHEVEERLLVQGEAMQEVEHRVPARLVLRVARGQHHDHVAVDRLSLKVAHQGRAVHLDVLDRDARHHGRGRYLQLGGGRRCGQASEERGGQNGAREAMDHRVLPVMF